MNLNDKIKTLASQQKKLIPSQSYSFFRPDSKAIMSIRNLMDSLGLMVTPSMHSFKQQPLDDSIQTTITVEWTWVDVLSGERKRDEVTVGAQGGYEDSVEAAMNLSEWVFFCRQLHLCRTFLTL